MADSPVGSYSIVPSLNDPAGKLGNYTVTINNAALTVGQASLSVTADNANRAYGAANPVFTGTLSGVQNNDPITPSYSCGAMASSPVGSYSIVPSLNDLGGELVNYTVTINNGILAVSPAELTVAADSASRAYGAANPLFTGTLNGLQNSDPITASYSSTATAATAVGTYPIVPSLNDPAGKQGNYAVTMNNGTLTVAPALLTVSANNASRAYGSVNPAFSGTLSGVQNDDAITPSYSCAATVVTPVGSYPIIPSLNDSGGRLSNYTVTANNGLLTITIPDFTISNATFLGSTFGCLVRTADGATYVLEYKNSIAATTWSVIQMLPGNGNIVSFTDDFGTNAARFYRIRSQ
jgi:hypothetical protein